MCLGAGRPAAACPLLPPAAEWATAALALWSHTQWKVLPSRRRLREDGALNTEAHIHSSSSPNKLMMQYFFFKLVSTYKDKESRKRQHFGGGAENGIDPTKLTRSGGESSGTASRRLERGLRSRQTWRWLWGCGRKRG